MKNAILFFLLSALSVNKPTVKVNDITAETVVSAIVKKDFDLINTAFDQRLLSPNEIYNGKYLLFHAIDQDNAEMVRLLISRGARLDYINAEGYNPKEYARRTQKIHALAEIIVITA